MNKRTKALQIPREVKDKVERRDSWDGWPCCIFCGSTDARAEAHVIPRSQGGLGVEKNTITVCRDCHKKLDHTGERQEKLKFAKEYLANMYEDWNEDDLVYRRELYE